MHISSSDFETRDFSCVILEENAPPIQRSYSATLEPWINFQGTSNFPKYSLKAIGIDYLSTFTLLFFCPVAREILKRFVFVHFCWWRSQADSLLGNSDLLQRLLILLTFTAVWNTSKKRKKRRMDFGLLYCKHRKLCICKYHNPVCFLFWFFTAGRKGILCLEDLPQFNLHFSSVHVWLLLSSLQR